MYALAALALVIIGYTVASVRIINQGNQALVERLGRYHRKLSPGLNFIVPFLDTIVLEDTTREQVLDIQPQAAITKDNVSLQVDAVVFWRILDLERMYYEIDDIETAIRNLVLTTLRSEMGQMGFEDTFASRARINQALLNHLDEVTAPWGVKVTRVEVQRIEPSKTVLESMERQQAAEIKKRAAIAEAEGTVESMRILTQAFEHHGKSSADVLRYLIAQRYVEANQRIGESDNTKILFMDPGALDEALTDLMGMEEINPSGHGGNGRSPGKRGGGGGPGGPSGPSSSDGNGSA
jgi:regulator of protease activity HflC (stomatin/prohibitin superfamily)